MSFLGIVLWVAVCVGRLRVVVFVQLSPCARVCWVIPHVCVVWYDKQQHPHEKQDNNQKSNKPRHNENEACRLATWFDFTYMQLASFF